MYVIALPPRSHMALRQSAAEGIHLGTYHPACLSEVESLAIDGDVSHCRVGDFPVVIERIPVL